MKAKESKTHIGCDNFKLTYESLRGTIGSELSEIVHIFSRAAILVVKCAKFYSDPKSTTFVPKRYCSGLQLIKGIKLWDML